MEVCYCFHWYHAQFFCVKQLLQRERESFLTILELYTIWCWFSIVDVVETGYILLDSFGLSVTLTGVIITVSIFSFLLSLSSIFKYSDPLVTVISSGKFQTIIPLSTKSQQQEKADKQFFFSIKFCLWSQVDDSKPYAGLFLFRK